MTSGDPGGPEAPRRSERRALRPRLRHCEEAASPAGSEGEAEGAPPSGEEGYGVYGVLWGMEWERPLVVRRAVGCMGFYGGWNGSAP